MEFRRRGIKCLTSDPIGERIFKEKSLENKSDFVIIFSTIVFV